jgi:hypothetical protein
MVLAVLTVPLAAVVVTAILTTRGGGSRPPAPRAKSAAPATMATAPAPALTNATRRAGVLPPLPHGPTGPAHTAPSMRPSVALPDHLTIKTIGVDSDLERLGLLPDHTLQSPAQWDEAGWYAGGIRPGDPGPAVIAGHVDSVSGPAVFYRLRDLRPGAVALIRLRTGHTLRFIVDAVHVYPKTQFPSTAVYGPAALPELRLVTCTGDFDRRAHSYVDNLVVTAHLAQ